MPAGGAGSGFSIRPDDLHQSGSKLGGFGDQLTQGGQKLRTLGQDLVSHASRDKSGIGGVIAKAMGSGAEVVGKVFSEGGRVAGAAGKRLHTSADNHLANETAQQNRFKNISAPAKNSRTPHGTSGGSAPKPAGTVGKSGSHGRTAPKSTGPGNNRPRNPQNTGTPVRNRNCATDPVDVATGEVVLAELDLELADVLPVLLERTHLSSYRAGRRFGANWAATVDQRLEIDSEGVCYFAPDGMILVYPEPEIDAPVLPAVGPRWPLSVRPGGTYQIEAAGRTLWFGTRSGVGPEVVELDAITEPGGRRIDFERAAEAILINHSAGYRVALHTEAGRVTELHVLGDDAAEAADVVVLRYGYDERGRLVELVNSSGLATRFEYDDAGRLIGWQDRTGTRYRYEYDAEGRCVRTAGPEGFFSGSFTYDRERRVTAFSNSLGQVTVYQLNQRHQTVRQTDPLGHATVFEWDEQHRLLSRTDPLDRTTRYEYRPDGTPAVVVRPDGSRVSVREVGAELAIEVGDGDRRWWRAYDERDRPDPFREPIGVSTAAGLPGAAMDAAPDATNPAGTGAGAARDTDERDMFGRPKAATDAAGRRVRLGWTIEGRLAWRATPNARESWSYDPEGNETEHLDPLGRPTSRRYGPFGLLLASTDATGARTAYGYDTELRLTSVTNPHGQTWRYTYDPAGRLVETIDFDGRRTRFDYDPAGRLSRAVNAAGQAVEYGYDVLGNLVEQRTSAGATRFRYDPVGQLVAATSPDATLAIERDERGRVRTQTVNGRTVSFDYDDETRTLRRRTPSGVDSKWRYDAAGRPESLDMVGHELSFRYDAAGREQERRIDGAIALHGTVDEATGVATHTVTRTAGEGEWPGNLLRYWRYDYRVDERLVGEEDGAGVAVRYQLDEGGRVGEVHRPEGVERYSYDAMGNLTASPATDTYHYAGTTLVRAGDTGYRHDPLGRLVHRSQQTAAGPREWHYTWDPMDRLTDVVTPECIRWQYRYDPLGRRIAKLRLDAAGAVAEQVEFAWDGSVLIEQVHTDATGRRVTTWAYDPADHRPVAQAEHGDRPEPGIQRFYTIVTDRIGTAVELLDTDGATAWQARTTLWGAPRPGGPRFAAGTPLRFPGQYHDAETGLHYNVFRYYDPATARYVSQDPLGLAPAANPVGYVSNPLSVADPLGLVCTASTSTSAAPVTPGANTTPHLVSGARSSKPVSDHAFNTTHQISDPALDHSAAAYLASGKKKPMSEAMGEQGALAYLRAHTGQNISGLHAASAASPHTLPTTQGQAWSHAVKFNSSGVADVSYWDGSKMHVIEAKGGGSQLGTRYQEFFHQDTTGRQARLDLTNNARVQMASNTHIDAVANRNYQAGERLPQVFGQSGAHAANELTQGTPSYLTDIGHKMAGSPTQDGRNLLGNQILQHQGAGNMHYVPVRTQAYTDGTSVGADVTVG